MDLLVNIDVDDLDRAVQFYTSAFGFKIGRRSSICWSKQPAANPSPRQTTFATIRGTGLPCISTSSSQILRRPSSKQ